MSTKPILENKVALVTGAGTGIGRAVAMAFAREGARVVVAGRTEATLAETVSLITENGGQACLVVTDVSKPSDCEVLVARTCEEYGRLDLACNNAGIAGDQLPTADYPVASWEKVIAVNLSGVFYGMKYQIPQILKAGGGAIVNMTSILGAVGFAYSPAYVAAKHGVIGLTQTAALEYAAQGVRINSVGPGFISTPLIAKMERDPKTLKSLIELHPVGRLGTADEVAALVLWLVSPAASFVHGSYYPIDGGYLAR